jgi:hypothetical protein
LNRAELSVAASSGLVDRFGRRRRPPASIRVDGFLRPGLFDRDHLSENDHTAAASPLRTTVTIFDALIYQSMSVKTNAARFQSTIFFSEFALKGAISTVKEPVWSRKSFVFSRVFLWIPYSWDQGILKREQGIILQEQGIFSG